MPAPRPVYRRNTKQIYPSAEAASRALSEESIFITGTTIGVAARATAAGRYATAGGSQWAFASQIPTTWPVRARRTVFSEKFLVRQPVVCFDGKDVEHFPSISDAAWVYNCSLQLISRAAWRTRRKHYAVAKGYQWAFLYHYEQENFEWPINQPRRDRLINNRRVIRSDLARFDSLGDAAVAVGGSNYAIQDAINGTLEGRYHDFRGFQWIWASVFDKPDFRWPYTKPAGTPVIRSDGTRFESLSEAARATNCSYSAVYDAAKRTSFGLHLTRKGYQWAYVSDFEKPGFEWP